MFAMVELLLTHITNAACTLDLPSPEPTLRSCQDNGSTRSDQPWVLIQEITSGPVDSFSIDALKNTTCPSPLSQSSSQTGTVVDAILTSPQRPWEAAKKEWLILMIWWKNSRPSIRLTLSFMVLVTIRDSLVSTKPQAWPNSHMDAVTEPAHSESQLPSCPLMERVTLKIEDQPPTSTHISFPQLSMTLVSSRLLSPTQWLLTTTLGLHGAKSRTSQSAIKYERDCFLSRTFL